MFAEEFGNSYPTYLDPKLLNLPEGNSLFHALSLNSQ
jgi:hypothetical protein